jgi:hypothetical protein
MYDVDLIRRLCVLISSEKDPQKLEDMLAVLRVVVNDNQEELKLRMGFLVEKYGNVLHEPNPNVVGGS